jgi:iron complex outermembrane recepter protein
MSRKILRWVGRSCLAGTLLVVFLTVSVHGQTASETGPQPAGNFPGNPDTVGAKSLDKLLELAEKDIGQLSQVKIGGATGSPSLDLPVSTVSRQESTVGRSPAAVFVITNEMIRRSGAKEIPEVLRMAPGVEVAKINSNSWAVSIRGFNGKFANKLLVQIDGREVYNALFGGTYWDVQDVLLEDVDRIEVIRGPGTTLWGTNAVNGVINIITKNAKDTQGTYVESGAGTYERGFTSARYGGRVNEDLNYRVYGKWFDRAPGYSPEGFNNDAWNQGRGGLRMDWKPSADDAVSFQGTYYNGYSGETDLQAQFAPPYFDYARENVHVAGDDVLLNWKRTLDADSDWAIKTYYDQTQRHWQQLAYDSNTFDCDFQDRFPLGDRHHVIWGFEYRNVQSFTTNSPILMVIPTVKSDNLYKWFVQDEITLREDLLFLTVGTELEQNSYTGFEFQPTARILYTPSKKYSLWSAVSRAVCVPTQVFKGAQAIAPPQWFVIPPLPQPLFLFPAVFGNENLLSEEVIAYEAGIRGQPSEKFSWDLAVFFNNYNRLDGVAPGMPYPLPTPQFLPLYMMNDFDGNTCGFELAATYQVSERWRLRPAYTYLVIKEWSANPFATAVFLPGANPCNQVYLQSSWDLGQNWSFDLIGRYCDSLPAFNVPKYIVADVRLARRVGKNFEFEVVGRNLFNGNFYQFGDDQYVGTRATEVQPEVYGQIVWRR